MRRASLPSLLLGFAVSAAADTITLTNGRVIEADRAWFEGTQLMYQKDGGVYGLPRSLVKDLNQRPAPDPTSDPDIRRARERLAASDPVEATRLLRLALGRDPRSVPALQALSEAYLALGDPAQARRQAERAIALDERNALSRALLGDALAALGERAGAETQYRRSLQLRPDPEVARKLSEVAPPPLQAGPGAQFRLRYDGGVNEPLGMAVLELLGKAYDEFSRRLGSHPDQPVTVVLQTEAEFVETGAPVWAGGINDGTIRVPVRGLERPTPRLGALLRHELAHSFVNARTGGNCPTWLQEGISQWLEGGDPSRQDAAARAAARAGRLLPLVSLEGPFSAMGEAEVTQAYAESLSAVAHILRLRGEEGLVRLLAALADRLPSEEALPVALGLSYPELQRSWEQSLAPNSGTSPR